MTVVGCVAEEINKKNTNEEEVEVFVGDDDKRERNEMESIRLNAIKSLRSRFFYNVGFL